MEINRMVLMILRLIRPIN